MRRGLHGARWIGVFVGLCLGAASAARAGSPTPPPGKASNFHVWNEGFQTRALVKLLIALNQRERPGNDAAARQRNSETLRYANQEVSYVVAGPAPAAEKARQIRALHVGVLQKLRAALPAPAFEKLLKDADALAPGEVPARLRAVAAKEIADPAALDKYIGETEKNLGITASLGGDASLLDLAGPAR